MPTIQKGAIKHFGPVSVAWRDSNHQQSIVRVAAEHAAEPTKKIIAGLKIS